MRPSIERETPDQPDVLDLLAQADARSASLYLSVSRHGQPVAALLAADVRFFVARRDGRALGCGGFVPLDDGAAEVKRIFVNSAACGGGVGRAIMRAIEGAAQRKGFELLLLETGVESFEALGLYRSLGFTERDPFGAYGPDPRSVFMTKKLA